MSNANKESEENSKKSTDEKESKIRVEESDYLNIIISILYFLSACVTSALFKFDVKDNFS